MTAIRLILAIVVALQLMQATSGQKSLNYFACPRGCTCEGTNVFCSSARISSIPILASSTLLVYDLKFNVIQSIIPGTFKNLKALKSLFLDNNRLVTIDRNAFQGLNEIEDLFLNDNKIETINYKAFSDLRKLKNLNLQKNNLRDLDHETFLGLYDLQKLLLSFNQLTRFREELIKSQSNLQVLRLDNNNLLCDCNMFWLWDAINPSNYSERIYRFDLTATCAYPVALNHKKFSELAKTDFNCDEPMIVVPPKDVAVDSSQGVSSARFECQATGNPNPQITWYKNNLRLIKGDSSKFTISNDNTQLVISNLDDQDFDRYTCVAKNKLGEVKVSAVLSHLVSENNQENDDLEFEDNDENYDVSEFETNEYNEPETETPARASESSSSGDLRFLTLPNDQKVLEGSTAKLSCRSSYYYLKPKWIKNGEPLSETRRFTIASNGDLEITDVRVEDEGHYVCSISNQRDVKYAQAKLTVNVPVAFIKKPIDQSSAEGNTVEFTCSAVGKPTPVIVWKKDDQVLKKTSDETSKFSHFEFYQNNQLLRINNVDYRNDQGIYTCSARNVVNMVSASARLSIGRSVAPYFSIRQQNISVFEDHPITLECFAQGDPKPQVLWYKNGQRIATDSRVYFDSYGYLAITQVKVSDSGEYLCRAVNNAGYDTHSFHLSVKDIYGTIISNSIINDAIEAAKNDVNNQFQTTLKNLQDKRRPKTSADLLALLRFPKDRTLNLVVSEEIYERALDIIFRYANNITFNLTNKEFVTQEILTHRQLQRISDLSGCHRHKRKVQCSQRCQNYRTFDGVCNNLQNPHRGAANTPLRRLLPAEYQNGFSTPKGWNKSQLYNGYLLPNARSVSTRIITTEKITADKKFTHMLMQWGQFLDHDLDHTVMAMSLNRFSNGIACRDSCTNDQPCFPIEIMPNDTLRTHWPGKCMEFVRSSAVCGTGETSLVTNQIHQREQINQLTAYIDASNVYGSNDQDAFDIRERAVNSGKLKVHITPKYPKGLLPFNLDTNMDCQRDNTTTVGCFLAGDHRANEQLALLAMHNLWVRQHNTLVDRLKRINPHWSPEQLYQEARKIVGAQMQVITFDHWLPHILGPTGMKRLGKFTKYQPHIDPTISNEFATAAFRFGHALIQPFTFRLNESFQPIDEGNLLLRDSFFAPQRYYYEGAMEPLMRGLYGVPAKLKMPREIMNSELTEKLFHITRSISQDLAALNIQRGRDHGLPGYNYYRRLCNLTMLNDFEDMKHEISSREVREILRELYGHVNNIDIWPAGILEDVVPGSKLGPLFMCIIVDQMKALRDGDRFWHENPDQFTPSQLAELKKTSLAKIICENGEGINHIQKDVFLNAAYPREMQRCSEIQDISLEPWRNCCDKNAVGLCGESSYFYVPVESSRHERAKKSLKLN